MATAERIEGTIKGLPEDFVVEEIAKSGRVLEIDKRYGAEELGMQELDGRFTIFVMQKRNWNTLQALTEVARYAGRGIKSVGFAGTKDRNSVSTQLCSIYGATPEKVLAANIKDISINGAWQASEQVRLGDLLGNRFTVRINGTVKNDVEKAHVIEKKLGGRFPNYFGEQRFGFRGNNVEMGLAIIKGDFRRAVNVYLTDTENETDAEAVGARKRLAEENDYAKAMEYFPQRLKYERSLIGYLTELPTDYAGAMRKLPRNLALMFVHSVDSYIFNKEVEERVESNQTSSMEGDMVCNVDPFGFPDLKNVFEAVDEKGRGSFIVGNLVGHESVITDREKKILDGLGITKDDFKVKAMPELNCRGSRRVLFAPYRDFSCIFDNTLEMRFSLPAGSYATVFMNEFLKR